MGARIYHRICRKCNQKKVSTEYDYWPSGKTIKNFCRACGRDSKKKPSVRGQGPHKVPHPCVTCGQEFTAMGIYSRVAKLRCCSQACIDSQRRVEERLCQRCHVLLPRSAFRPQACNSYQVARVCARCQDDADDHFCTNLRPRPSAYQMWLTAQQRAKRLGVPFRLSRKQVDRYYVTGCQLCDRAASHLLLKAPEQGYCPSNIRKVCRRCNKILKNVSYEELLLTAHEIAVTNPLVPGETPYGVHHPLRRPDPKPPKPKRRPKAALQPAP